MEYHSKRFVVKRRQTAGGQNILSDVYLIDAEISAIPVLLCMFTIIIIIALVHLYSFARFRWFAELGGIETWIQRAAANNVD